MSEHAFQPSTCNRRRLFGWAAGAGCAFLVGRAPRAGAATSAPRSLHFYSIHTREALEAVYWHDGRYDPSALAAIDHHLRDFRSGDVKPIDVRLLDLLHALNERLGNGDPVHVISGYRSPATNAMLARRSRQVAKNSYHVKGMAIDVRVPAYRLADLRDAALGLCQGGVGYYPGSNFIHLDTGPVRAW